MPGWPVTSGAYADETPSAWSWEAGSASGLSGDEVASRGHAAERLWSGEAHKAVVWMVLIVTGGPALDGHYQPVAGTRVKGPVTGGR